MLSLEKHDDLHISRHFGTSAIRVFVPSLHCNAEHIVRNDHHNTPSKNPSQHARQIPCFPTVTTTMDSARRGSRRLCQR